MRWKILILLFLVRMTMAFQFASIGALGPLYETTFQINTAALGFLIGLYLLPGIFVSIPGGSLGARFGDKNVVVLGLGLIVVGGAVMASFDAWSAQIAGRVIAGAGGVFINVMMTKMVADWFSGREIATAMALFVNSWPAGIAVALLVMPVLADAAGLSLAVWFIGGLSFIGLCLMAAFYQSPKTSAAAPKGVMPRGFALGAVISAGVAWGLFNAALGMVFTFGPANLVERGRTLVEASAATSIVIWFVMAAGFAGGVIADRTGRPVTLLFASTLAMGLCMYLFPLSANVAMLLVFLGIATGLPTGIYVSLAAQSLSAPERALGMGIFWMAYYVIFSASPWIAGKLIDASGSTAIAFQFGTVLTVLGLMAVLSCLGFQRRLKS